MAPSPPSISPLPSEAELPRSPRTRRTSTYYDNDWLHTVTESPSGDVTTFGYDGVGNLLSEVRTGTKPYSGTYTYYADNQRKTAIVVTNGVTTHNGTYTYDGAGRLSQCVDTSTIPTTTETYVWNNDSTLFSSPGNGYTKQFYYNEESQLATIEHNTGGTITTAYEYGYGADGGRRWKKDIANNLWTWYPCGASCSAGVLVEQTSDLTGVTWTTSAFYLRTGGSCGSTLIRRVSSTDSEYHHFDVRGNIGIISSSSANVLASYLYDSFRVQRYENGSAQTPWVSPSVSEADDGLLLTGTSFYLPGRGLGINRPIRPLIAPIVIGVIITAICSAACACAIWGGSYLWHKCQNSCANEGSAEDTWFCVLNCWFKSELTNPLAGLSLVGCLFCICVAITWGNVAFCTATLIKIEKGVKGAAA